MLHELIITRVGKEVCSFLYDIIRGVRIEKGVFLYGSEEVSSLLAWGYYINNRKFCYESIKRFYRIPYQNIAGDIGFYIYQQIYPFYGFCLILATYGFPVIISKIVAERLERGKQEEAEEIICVSFGSY